MRMKHLTSDIRERTLQMSNLSLRTTKDNFPALNLNVLNKWG